MASPSVNSTTVQRAGCTLRAFAVGCLLCAFIGVLGPYNVIIRRGSYLFLDFAAPGVFGLLFFLVLLNSLLKFVRRSWALDPAEILVVTIMMLMAGSVVTMGYMLQIFSFMSAGRFFADASNEYAKYILAHTPSWMLVNDDRAIGWFYKGIPEGQGIPWAAWAKPFLGWLPLILSVYLVMICLMVIVRRQWAEHERLVYPQAQLPLAMAGDPDDRHAFPALYRSALFWIGFAVPFTISALNGLHGYIQSVPNVRLSTSIPMFRGASYLSFRLSFPWVGFSYLLNLDVGLSLWFFALVAFVQQGIFKIRGIKSDEFLGIYGANTTPIIAHQGMGAFLVFVAVILWMGRRHLGDVLRKAIRNDPAVDDSDEMMSYRGAVIGTLAGSLVFWIWMTLAGLPFWLGPAFIVLAMVIFFGLTRIVVQGGFPSIRPPSIAQPMLLSGLGSGAFGPSGIVALCYTYAWAADIRTFPMVPAAHAGKMSERIGRKRGLFAAMWLGILVTLLVSFFATLKFAHEKGGLGAKDWFFGPAQKWAFDFGVTKIRDLEKTASVDGRSVGGAVISADFVENGEAVRLTVRGTIGEFAIGGSGLRLETMTVRGAGGESIVDFSELPADAACDVGESLICGATKLGVETFGGDREPGEKAVRVVEETGPGGSRKALALRSCAVTLSFDPPVREIEVRVRRGTGGIVVGANGERLESPRFLPEPAVFEEGRIDTTRPYLGGYLHKAVGALVMGILIFLRNRFYWWPIHPIGYVVGGIWMIQQVWISIFVTWVIKALVLKLGGARAYHRLVPLFLGVIVGQFAAALMWVGIDTVFGKVDNAIFWF